MTALADFYRGGRAIVFFRVLCVAAVLREKLVGTRCFSVSFFGVECLSNRFVEWFNQFCISNDRACGYCYARHEGTSSCLARLQCGRRASRATISITRKYRVPVTACLFWVAVEYSTSLPVIDNITSTRPKGVGKHGTRAVSAKTARSSHTRAYKQLLVLRKLVSILPDGPRATCTTAAFLCTVTFVE